MNEFSTGVAGPPRGLFVAMSSRAKVKPGRLLQLVGDGVRDEDGGYTVLTSAGCEWVDGADVLDLGPWDQVTARAAQRAATPEPDMPTPPDDLRNDALRTAMLICTPQGHPGRDVRTVLTAATTIEQWLRTGRLPDDATDS